LNATYFFTLIKRQDRVMGERTRVACDLSGMDYAIQVDLENDKIKALCIPVKSKGRYTNIKVNRGLFNKALAKMPAHLTITLKYCFSHSEFITRLNYHPYSVNEP